jgi:hypothetical protein
MIDPLYSPHFQDPNLDHYVSFGAGVQSSMMVFAMMEGEITPAPKAVIFADVGAEPSRVYEWLEYVKSIVPFPVITVKKPGLSLTEHSLQVKIGKKTGKPWWKSGVPMFTKSGEKVGLMRRACTSDMKIEPVQKKLKELSNKKRGDDSLICVQMMGISFDEMQRMKQARHPWFINRYPLVENKITRQDCINWMKWHGYEEPPRSACVYCPYHDNKEWQRVRNQSEKEFQQAVEYEKRAQECARQVGMESIPFLHRSCVPIDEVDFEADSDQHEFGFVSECEGMCGV